MSAPDTLRLAHDLLRKAVGPLRRKAAKENSILAATYRAAMAYWDEQKAQGVSFDERRDGLEKTLRVSWPKADHLCHCPRCLIVCRDCEDTGALYEKRPSRIYMGRMATVVVPCHCDLGRRFESKMKPGPDDFTAAGKSKPMTRIGR